MKLSILTMVLICFILSTISTPSQAYNISQNICEYIASDDKKRLRSLLKTNRMKLRGIYKDVFCNNKNILLFSAERNATNVGALIIKKLPKTVIKENLAELESLSPDLASKAKERLG